MKSLTLILVILVFRPIFTTASISLAATANVTGVTAANITSFTGANITIAYGNDTNITAVTYHPVNTTEAAVDLTETPWLYKYEGANCDVPPGVKLVPLPRCPATDFEIWFQCIEDTDQKLSTRAAEMSYRWSTNIHKRAQELEAASGCFSTNFTQQTAAQAKEFLNSHEDQLSDLERRELIFWADSIFPLDEGERKKKQEIDSKMVELYSTGEVCPPAQACTEKWSLAKIDNYLATSSDYDGLAEVWNKWRDATGSKMRQLFQAGVKLRNKGAIATGKEDYGAALQTSYEFDEPGFFKQLETLWTQILPLYEELHTYVRSKMVEVYPGKFNKHSSMPAHIFGNMWAQSWSGLMKYVLPFEDDTDLDEAMLNQNYTVKKMFLAAEQFFKSLGFMKLPPSFWQLSVIEQENRTMVCHASAWDFMNGQDFAIKMCTRINLQDFNTIHHELGHIYYYTEYTGQRQMFRSGANPAFHEAIGDTLSLSFYADSYLKHLKLITADPTEKQVINRLMHMALDSLAFFPFGYTMDLYRWKIYKLDATTPTKDLNVLWWNLREQYQGIFPPSARTEKHFDPGSKYHIADSVPYIRYFISYMLVYQFHESLCREVDPNLPLHKCSIFNSLKAGEKLRKALSLGDSVPWPQVLRQLTGSDKISVEPMKKFYQPLLTWLKKENKRLGNCYGWGVTWPNSSHLEEPRCEPWNVPLKK